MPSGMKGKQTVRLVHRGGRGERNKKYSCKSSGVGHRGLKAMLEFGLHHETYGELLYELKQGSDEIKCAF